MSSLLFLTTDDFTLMPSDEGNILHIEIMGFSLILFYSTHCVYCQKLIPGFKRLPDIVNGCQFGMLNVSVNRSLTDMSKKSITPITVVPLIILYINGGPYMRYVGPLDEINISKFIFETSKAVHESGFARITKEKGIPSYSLGNPLYGEDEVSYLDFNEHSGYIKPHK
jgi:thiol-disulfide isomerase/thioredoxin